MPFWKYAEGTFKLYEGAPKTARLLLSIHTRGHTTRITYNHGLYRSYPPFVDSENRTEINAANSLISRAKYSIYHRIGGSAAVVKEVRGARSEAPSDEHAALAFMIQNAILDCQNSHKKWSATNNALNNVLAALRKNNVRN